MNTGVFIAIKIDPEQSSVDNERENGRRDRELHRRNHTFEEGARNLSVHVLEVRPEVVCIGVSPFVE